MFEKPLECSGCTAEGCLDYITLEKGLQVGYSMCAECPLLQLKLHGEATQVTHNIREEGLSCLTCGTNLQSLKIEHKVGCPDCYVIFEERLREIFHPIRFHVGRSTEDASLSSRAAELNIELSEALKKENYEHAAYLRDQIKELIHDKSS
ncbi:MAG: UvrB/UvrC motif-containing protein [Simkaniaceae bacterium]|nr:UvrB/UvrC motif-containing protein [Simkaniaceae bacterium]